MSRRDHRLLPVALGVWISALGCILLPGVWGWWAALCGAAATAAVAWRGRGGLGARMPRALAALALCAGAATALTVGFATADRERLAAWDGRIVEVVAEISSSSTTGRDGRIWFDARVERAGPVGRSIPLDAPVRVGVDADGGGQVGGGYDLGARIRVMGAAKGTDAGERAALVVFGTSAEVVAPASGVFALAAGVRQQFSARALMLPPPGGALLPGLAVGDTRAVSAELDAAMITSGLSHLTAVSGANCALVVGATFWVVSLLGGGRRLRVLISLAVLAAFVVLVTPEPSVVRAATMAGLAMVTVLLGSPAAGSGVLALAVVLILVTDPWLAAAPGFALSVAATAALVMLAPPVARGLRRWMPAPIAVALAVPWSAHLACAPLIALFSEEQSLIAIAANIVAAPAAPLATVLGLIACLAAPLPALADILTASAWLPAAWIAGTAVTSAAVSGARLLITPGLGMALLIGVISAAGAVLTARGRGNTAPSALAIRCATAVVVVTVALGAGRLLLTGPLASLTSPADWAIAACDVGQGDAVLARSAGLVALIDVGPDPDALSSCLTALGIEQVHLLVLTHFDLDHVGGVSAVIGRVDTVLHGPAETTKDERMLAELHGAGAHLIPAAAGLHGALGEAHWRVLWPRLGSTAVGNDASVVLSLRGGGIPETLFLGDLSAVPQRMLGASGTLDGPYDVVKVAHHGSADQAASLYEVIGADVALFSVGADNDYGHPRADTLALLESTGARVVRTDLQGRVLLGRRDDALAIWAERAAPAPAESVAPDGEVGDGR